MSIKSFLKQINHTPHAKKLGLQLVTAEGCTITLKLPFNDSIIGDPINRYIHSGAITTLVDTACGVSIFQTQNNTRAMATLDLRIDHQRPAILGNEIFATAECYKLTHTIAFVNVTVYEDDITNPIATAVGTFMRSNKEFPHTE
ncbi:MAG: thioesterase [Cycloclasticus sp.]|nr:MAG: thioesterase [Cycloclasticus sp.]